MKTASKEISRNIKKELACVNMTVTIIAMAYIQQGRLCKRKRIFKKYLKDIPYGDKFIPKRNV